MNKYFSRIKKIEYKLIPEKGGIRPVPIISWNLSNSEKYFKNKDEQKDYQTYRVYGLQEEYHRMGLVVPIMVTFDEQDVQKHIESFRKLNEILNPDK